MSELLQILRVHAKKYPLMQPRDVIKLVYQNEFGGGHLIRDERECFLRIRDELSQLQPQELPFYEEIGNGMVRVNLASLERNGMTPGELCEIFICSSREHRGNADAFCVKLAEADRAAETLGLSFPVRAWRDELSAYRAKGCPMISHSEIFRDTYHPAYRVVEKRLLIPEK